MSFDFVNVRKVARLIATQGVAGRVAVIVAVEAKLHRFGLAPFRMKHIADQIENHRWTERQPVSFRQDVSAPQILIHALA
jgi:hypothetical protein